MSEQEKNVRVSFKLSREAAIKLREIALTKGDLLCSLGVLAVQLGNESQICISSPLNFNYPSCEGARKEKRSEEGFDSELTDSAGDLSDGEKMDEDESSLNLVDGGVREVDQEIALATAASVKLSNDIISTEVIPDTVPLTQRTTSDMNARNALFQQIHSTRSKEVKVEKQEQSDGSSSGNKISQDLTSGRDSPDDNDRISSPSNKFDGPGLSFAQQLINLSKQYRQENSKFSPTDIAGDKYFASNNASQIVGRDHVLRYFNDKPEDFMGLSVNNSILFDSYGTTSVKSAEEMSKEQSEISPTLATNLDSMSVSSPDSLFEEARLGSVDELSLSPTSAPVSIHNTSRNNTPSPSESHKSETSSPLKLKRSMKFQKLLKGQTGIVCELCMHAVQKSYSCYQMSYAPKEIMHLFNDGSRCVRVCRRCLPYKAPKGNDKNGNKKAKKTTELSE